MEETKRKRNVIAVLMVFDAITFISSLLFIQFKDFFAVVFLVLMCLTGLVLSDKTPRGENGEETYSSYPEW
jgi:hypothetical protein